MSCLKIQTVIHSRYQIFDKSGGLPFSIVFGLVRRSTGDSDARPLVLSMAKTVLDVPYALSHGLLTLQEHDAESDHLTDVDVNELHDLESEQQSFMTLSSPVGRAANWKDSLSVYHYWIDPNSKLASILEPGKRYTIRITNGQDLGVDWHAYGDPEALLNEDGIPSVPSENARLVSGRADGRATFTAQPSLPWPPVIQTTMRLCDSGSDEIGPSDSNPKGAATLDISVLNTGAEPITVQTRGRQRFLVPWGPMQPEADSTADSRARIVDGTNPAAAATLQVLDLDKKDIVRAACKPGICGLTAANLDPRPRLDTLVTLRSGEPLVRRVDISRVLDGLPDGRYGLRMEPRGMWWCVGSCEDFAAGGEDRVPHALFRPLDPPLMLECEDVVEVSIEDGDVK